MDERLGRKKVWIAGGGLAILFLCVLACGLMFMAFAVTHAGSAYGVVPYVQPPAGEESGEAAPPIQYGYGPFGMGRHSGFGPMGFLSFGIGLVFKLLLFGLLFLLLLGLIKRIAWGHLAWHHMYRYGPPKGKEGEGKPQAAWGPWAWHRHRAHWGPPPWWGPAPEAAGEEGETDEPYTAEE
jgi:hypothetical protein